MESTSLINLKTPPCFFLFLIIAINFIYFNIKVFVFPKSYIISCTLYNDLLRILNPTGIVADINGIVLAKVTHALGAGRTYAAQPIDHSVGVKLTKSCGDIVLIGEVRIISAFKHSGCLSISLSLCLRQTVSLLFSLFLIHKE